MEVFLTGGTGFVGEAVAEALLARGHRVTALVRDPARAGPLLARGVRLVTGDVLAPRTLDRALAGCGAVVHLVGIIVEPKGATFDDLHRVATLHVLAATERAGIRRYLHMSALGTRPNAVSPYHTTKWAAEEAVRASPLEATIFRPSVIYGGGPGDKFFRMLAGFYRKPFFVPVPVIGRGRALLQPVAREDVAACFAAALERPQSVARAYEVVGPERMEFRRVLRLVGEAMGRRRLLMPMPPPVLRLLAAAFLERLDPPPLTRAQITMALEDNVGDPGPMTRDLGVEPRAFTTSVRSLVASLPEAQARP